MTSEVETEGKEPAPRRQQMMVAVLLGGCALLAGLGMGGVIFFQQRTQETAVQVAEISTLTPSPSATSTLPSAPIYTAAALTAQALQTSVPSIGQETPSPSQDLPVPLPGQPASSIAQEEKIATLNPTSPTLGDPGCLRVEYIEDITVPDGTQFHPGEAFVKTWRFRNAGTCTWTPEYHFMFYYGEQMGAPFFISMPYDVPTGETVDLSLEMVAPLTPGWYESYWIFSEPTVGETFGFGATAKDPIWVRIEVVFP